MFTFSGFGDEISADLDEQLAALKSMGINYLELRGAWGKNVLDFDEAELKRIKQALTEQRLAISSIGSPIGKVDIETPFQPHLEDFRRILHIAEFLGSPYVRIFSFYVAQGEQERYRTEVLGRMETLVRTAEGAPLTLLHENEKDIYGDTPERCADILHTINSPKLRAVFDPANYVQVGVANCYDRGWPLLGDYVVYVHVKDALLSSGEVVLAGKGDGQVRQVLQALKNRGGDYFLSLEPHLIFAGRTVGFTGQELFQQAVDALRDLIHSLDQGKK